TTIHFVVPKLGIVGDVNLTVRTRGGVAQKRFTIIPKPLAELANVDINTVAGGVAFLGDGGLAASANTAINPRNIAIDGAGNLFIADISNHRIRRVDSQSGIITTVAGNGQFGFSGDGEPATTASLDEPFGV